MPPLPAPVAALTPRGRLVLPFGLALAAAGLGGHYPVLVGLGLALFVLVLAEVTAVCAGTQLGVHREVGPETVVRNEPCRGVLHLRGRRRSTLVRVDAHDRVDGRMVPVALHQAAADGGPGETVVEYDIPTSRRGLVEVGPVQVRRSGLTGMAAHASDVGDVVTVRVLPRRIPLAGTVRGRRRAVNATGNSAEYGGTDLVGLHEYVVGDDLRRLHWPTSARTGHLMVREDADPSEPHELVLLDDRRDSYREGAEDFEEAVEIAAAVCRVAVEGGHPLRWRTASGRHEVDVPSTTFDQLSPEAQHLEWLLAEIQPTEAPLRDLGTRDVDVFVGVTGAAADRAEIALTGAVAHTAVHLVVDPAPEVTVNSGPDLVVRARTAAELADAWNRTVAR